MTSEPQLAVDITMSELQEAARLTDLPVVVWELPAGTIRLVTPAVEQLLGVAYDHLTQETVIDRVLPHESAALVVAAFETGAVAALHSVIELNRADGEVVQAWVWSTSVQLDGRRAAISLVVPESDVASIGRDPAVPWRSLASIVVGIADPTWSIETVSADARVLLGREPAELLGSSLFDLLPDEVRSKAPRDEGAASPSGVPIHVRVRRGDGELAEMSLLHAPVLGDSSGRIMFALIGAPPEVTATQSGRVDELEQRLRRIAAEVRAAGVLDAIAVMPSAADLPQLGELTTRQWDIVSRLLRGDRVHTIATALFLSESTVRNHLTKVFQKFGVHSQAELLEHLRQQI